MTIKSFADSKAGADTNPFAHLTRIAHASGAGKEAATASKKISGVSWKPEQLGQAVDTHRSAADRHERAARMAEEIASHPETHSTHRAAWAMRAKMHRESSSYHSKEAVEARRTMPQPRHEKDGTFLPKP